MSGSFVPSYLANAYLTGAMPSQQPVVMPNTGFLQTLLNAPTASPLESRETANRSALEVLTNLAGGPNPNDTPYGGQGPQGLRGTGNPLTDIPAATRAFGPALATFANPMGLPSAVIGGMVGAAARAASGIPNPTAPQFGLQAMARGIQEAIYGITPEERAARTAYSQLQAAQDLADQGLDLGYGGLSPEGAAAAATVSEGIAAGFGPEAPGYSAPTEGSFGGFSESDFGGAGGVGEDSGPGGVGEARRGGLATDNGFLGPEKFAQGGAVVELQGGGKIAVGPGGGLDDLIPTSINGKRAAALSDGEFVIPADVVSMMGDGSSNAGARRLYDLVRQIRQSKTGTSRQAGPLPVGEILKRTMR